MKKKTYESTFLFVLQSSFWFIPIVMVLAAAGLAVGLTELDRRMYSSESQTVAWFYSGDPESAISILSMIAGSMVTVTGVVFSITTVALTLAASNFGSRLLTSFTRDRGNKLVMGAFISAFMYCLLVLRVVRSGPEPFVPRLAVLAGIAIATACVFVLIYFIHHFTSVIKVDYLIFLVERDLLDSMETLYPEEAGLEEGDVEPRLDPPALPEGFESESVPVTAEESGYIQKVELDKVLVLARERNLVISLDRSPGAFVTRGTVLARVWPPGQADEEAVRSLRASIALEDERTPIQDLEFPISQLVEIAIRALSPGINDTFTALACVDRLTSFLSRFARRKIPSPYRYDDEGRLRIVAKSTGMEEALRAAFTLIRQNANFAVAIRLLQGIEQIALQVRCGEDRKHLAEHAGMISRAAGPFTEANDRQAVGRAYEAAMRALGM